MNKLLITLCASSLVLSSYAGMVGSKESSPELQMFKDQVKTLKELELSHEELVNELPSSDTTKLEPVLEKLSTLHKQQKDLATNMILMPFILVNANINFYKTFNEEMAKISKLAASTEMTEHNRTYLIGWIEQHYKPTRSLMSHLSYELTRKGYLDLRQGVDPKDIV